MGSLLERFVITRVLSRFLASLPATLSAYVDVDELVRVVVTTFVTTQDPKAVLPTLLAHVETIVPPQHVALAKSVLTLAIELLDRVGSLNDIKLRLVDQGALTDENLRKLLTD